MALEQPAPAVGPRRAAVLDDHYLLEVL